MTVNATAFNQSAAEPFSVAAFYQAIREANMPALNTILADPRALTAKDVEGNGPISTAIRSKKPEVVKLLLAQGADPNATNNILNTPLMECAFIWQPDIVKLLLAAGADPNQARKGGEAALHFAATAGDRTTVALLIDAGANILRQSSDGYDAAMKAQVGGDKEMAVFIRKTAADRDARLAAEKIETERRQNVESAVTSINGGLATAINVMKPIRIARRI